MLKLESLHNHTTLSDGTLEPLELLAAAEQQRIGVMALTDHDTVPDKTLLSQLRAYDGPVNWTVGLELSCQLPPGMGDGKEAYIHVLGLFIDLDNWPLRELLAELEAGRHRRLSVMVEHLQSLGLKINADDCYRQATGRIVGSPQVVKALGMYPENAAVISALSTELVAAAQSNVELNMLVKKLKTDGPAQVPYLLFMSQSSFKPMPRADNYVPSLDEGARIIRAAGGQAILAHWHFAKDHLPAGELLQLLQDKRFDGVETFLENAINRRDLAAETKELETMVAATRCLATIGANAHDEADLAAFRRHPKSADSIGQTQRLIDRLNPNLAFSKL